MNDMNSIDVMKKLQPALRKIIMAAIEDAAEEVLVEIRESPHPKPGFNDGVEWAVARLHVCKAEQVAGRMTQKPARKNK